MKKEEKVGGKDKNGRRNREEEGDRCELEDLKKKEEVCLYMRVREREGQLNCCIHLALPFPAEGNNTMIGI